MERKFEDRPVMISDGSRLLSINLDEVCRFKAAENYTDMFFTDNKKPVTLSRRLGELEKILSQSYFVRIGRSDIINIWHVRMVMGKRIIMKDGEELLLGNKYADALEDKFFILEEKRN